MEKTTEKQLKNTFISLVSLRRIQYALLAVCFVLAFTLFIYSTVLLTNFYEDYDVVIDDKTTPVVILGLSVILCLLYLLSHFFISAITFKTYPFCFALFSVLVVWISIFLILCCLPLETFLNKELRAISDGKATSGTQRNILNYELAVAEFCCAPLVTLSACDFSTICSFCYDYKTDVEKFVQGLSDSDCEMFDIFGNVANETDVCVENDIRRIVKSVNNLITNKFYQYFSLTLSVSVIVLCLFLVHSFIQGFVLYVTTYEGKLIKKNN